MRPRPTVVSVDMTFTSPVRPEGNVQKGQGWSDEAADGRPAGPGGPIDRTTTRRPADHGHAIPVRGRLRGPVLPGRLPARRLPPGPPLRRPVVRLPPRHRAVALPTRPPAR